MGRVTRPCVDCGVLVTKNPHGGRPHLCVPCGQARVLLAADEMRNKQGKAFERWAQRVREVSHHYSQAVIDSTL